MGIFSRKEPTVRHVWVQKGKIERRVVRETEIARLVEGWVHFVCAECGQEIVVRDGWVSAVYRGSDSPLGPYWHEHGPAWELKESDSESG